MHADERDICNYLKSSPGQFVSLREICRRAGGKRRFRDEPNWAVIFLQRLVEKGLVESDASGHYRLRPRTRNEKPRRWIAPEIKKILEASGKKFDDVKPPEPSLDDLENELE